MERVADFLPRTKNVGAAALTKQLYLFLQALGAEDTLNALAETMRAQGRLPEADEVLREWNVVMDLLNQLALLLGDEVLAPADYAELFTLLLRTTDMGHIPQSLDSVILTTAGRMRLPETDAVFVVGLLEGEFPQTPGDQGLLTHADRDLMIHQGAELPDCFENKVLREGICFYKALTVSQRFLWLSWPGAAHAEDTDPASAALAPVLNLLQAPFVQPTAAELAAAPAAALDVLGVLTQDPAQSAAGAAVRTALDEAEKTGELSTGYAAVVRIAQDDPDAPTKVQNTAALEKLLGRELRISPTRFEKYQTCPFGYFLQYILRAAPRQKAELAPNISGTLTHWVLENALRRQGAAFKDLTPEELQALVDSLVDEYVTANLPGATVRMQYLVERIRRNLVNLLGFIQRDLRQSGFQPVAFELRIDDRPGDDVVDFLQRTAAVDFHAAFVRDPYLKIHFTHGKTSSDGHSRLLIDGLPNCRAECQHVVPCRFQFRRAIIAFYVLAEPRNRIAQAVQRQIAASNQVAEDSRALFLAKPDVLARQFHHFRYVRTRDGNLLCLSHDVQYLIELGLIHRRAHDVTQFHHKRPVISFQRLVAEQLAVLGEILNATDVSPLLARCVHDHAVRADKAVNKRLDHHATKADLAVGNQHTRLHDVAGYDFRLYAGIHDLDVHSVVRHLATLNGRIGHLADDGQDALRNVQVVDAAVAVRQERAHITIEGADEPPGWVLLEPAVHVLHEQFRVLLAHQLVILGRNVKVRTNLPVRVLRHAKLQAAVLQFQTDLRALLPVEHLHATGVHHKVALCVGAALDFLCPILQTSACFHNSNLFL